MKIKKITDPIFQMSRSERNGAIVLSIILILLVIFRFAIPKLFQHEDEIPQEVTERMMQIERNQDSIFAVQAERKYSKNKGSTNNQSFYKKNTDKNSSGKIPGNVTSVLFKFDPNVVTKEELLKLGFSTGVANVVLKYRGKGGKFKSEDDLKKIYGVDSILFNRVRPFISIERKIDSTFTKPHVDDIIVEVNSADSASWTTLKGIGPSYAGRICKYRKMLGGFTSEQQLLEIYNFPQETFDAVKASLIVDISKVKKININFADISELKSHPYCKYENAKKIVNYRSRLGSYKSIDQLLTDSVLVSEVFLKLSPYLSVE